MSRTLSPGLDVIARGDTVRRFPGWSVEVYDVRSTTDTIRDVVVDNVLQAETGPWDVSDLVKQVAIVEQAGSYVTGAVAATSITVTIVDALGTLDPMLTAVDPAAEGRFFRAGNVVRIREGDHQVPVEEWPITFTGVFLGQSGYDRNLPDGTSELRLFAVGREATFLHYKRTTEAFNNEGGGTSYFEMAESVATKEMDLDQDELDFPSFGSATIPHLSVQLVDENPITMLARIMFLDSLIPKFTGDGKLSAIADRATGTAARIYTTRDHIRAILRPQSNVDAANSIVVIGLDAQLSRVDQPRQTLATLDITTGFFTQKERVKVYFRDDRSLMADNVKLLVLRSINGGLLPLGGDEEIELIPSGDPDQVGTVGVLLKTESGFAPWLVVFFMSSYVAASFFPDNWAGQFSGVTIRIGTLVQGISLAQAMLVLMQIGRGSYAFEGDPFEYVFKEVREAARLEGVTEFAGKNEIEIQNHLVSTSQQAKDTAFQALFRAQAEKYPRTIRMLHDLAVEPNDIIEFQDDGSRYLVGRITRTLTLDPGAAVVTISAFDISASVSVGS